MDLKPTDDGKYLAYRGTMQPRNEDLSFGNNRWGTAEQIRVSNESTTLSTDRVEITGNSKQRGCERNGSK